MPSMGFGPTPEHYGDRYGDGTEETKIVELAAVGQAGLTEMELTQVGEWGHDKHIPLETPDQQRVGTISNLHFSQSRNALVGEITTDRPYTDSDLHTIFSVNKRRVERVVLTK